MKSALRSGLAAVLVFGAIAVPVSRSSAETRYATGVTCAKAFFWQRARSLTGHYAAVKGRIVQTYFARSSSGQPTFLDMGNAYPNSNRFTVLIWSENRRAFGGSPETRFRGRTVCATGLVQTYRGVPEIVARTRSQVRIVR